MAWYSGHPDAATVGFDLSSLRVVVVGSGNVALDVARVLILPLESPRRTDHALAALAGSAVEEVVLLARRGPRAPRSPARSCSR